MIRNPSPGERPPGTCDGIATTPRKNPVKTPNNGPKIRTAITFAIFTRLPQRPRVPLCGGSGKASDSLNTP